MDQDGTHTCVESQSTIPITSLKTRRQHILALVCYAASLPSCVTQHPCPRVLCSILAIVRYAASLPLCIMRHPCPRVLCSILALVCYAASLPSCVMQHPCPRVLCSILALVRYAASLPLCVMRHLCPRLLCSTCNHKAKVIANLIASFSYIANLIDDHSHT